MLLRAQNLFTESAISLTSYSSSPRPAPWGCSRIGLELGISLSCNSHTHHLAAIVAAARQQCSNIKIRLAHLLKAYPPPQAPVACSCLSSYRGMECLNIDTQARYNVTGWRLMQNLNSGQRLFFPLPVVARSCRNRRMPITQSMA